MPRGGVVRSSSGGGGTGSGESFSGVAVGEVAQRISAGVFDGVNAAVITGTPAASDIIHHDGTTFVLRKLYIQASDPGAVADGSIWIDIP